jgi:hypothetical protein
VGTSPRNIPEVVVEVVVEVAAEDNNKDIEVEDRGSTMEEVAGFVDKGDSVQLTVIEADYSVMVALEARGILVPFAPLASFPYPYHFPLLSFSKST